MTVLGLEDIASPLRVATVKWQYSKDLIDSI